MIYLASPYSHPNQAIVLARYHAALAYTADHIKRGFAIFSPIVHCHTLANEYGMATDFAGWRTYNEAMLRRSLALWILTLDGWEESIGVRAEKTYAEKHGIPIYYMAP